MILETIANAFDLSVVRARSALRAALFHFALVASIAGVKSATNALYLARRDPADLPWLYVGTALTIATVTAYLGKRLSAVSARYVLRAGLMISAIVLGVLGALAALDVRQSLGVLYVAGEAFATALSVLFWARLGEVFDVRAAKRVFGFIAAAGMAGSVVGGIAVITLANAGAPAVVWFFLTPTVAVLLCILIGGGTPGTLRRERVRFSDGLKYAAGRTFPIGVAVLVAMFAVHAAATDFVFRTGTHRFEGGDEASMAALFGTLNAVVGMLAIAFQGTLTARLLKHLGVFVYLSIIPVLSVTCALWAIITPSMFVPLFLMKLVEMMGSYSLNQTGLQLLYNPMPSAVHGSLRAVIDGAVKKLGGAIGGVVLLVAGALVSTETLLGVVIALGVFLLLTIRWLQPRYVKALQQKLGDRGLAPMPVIDPADRSTRQELVRALHEGDADRTLSAVSVLENQRDVDCREHIEVLIKHPSEAVRLKAVELIMRAPDNDYVPFLVSVIRKPGRHPKAQAARALVMIDPVTARQVLEPILESPDTDDNHALVTAAIAALLGGAHAGEDAADEGAAKKARKALELMLDDLSERPTSELRMLAHLLGMLGPGPYAHRLIELLDAPVPSVRLAAIDACGKARDERIPAHLVQYLGDRSVQTAVRTALAQYGDLVVPILARFLDNRHIEVSARVQVPATLRMIGSEKAANAMLFSNRHDDPYLLYVIIEELGRMRRRDPQLKFHREQTEGAVIRRLRAYTHYRAIAADIGQAGPPFELLHRVVDDRVRQNLASGLKLLGLLHGMQAMETSYHGFASGSRADAVELLDVALAGSDIRSTVLEHVEAPDPKGEGVRAVEKAHALVEGRDIQLAVVAAETLRRIGETPQEVRKSTFGEPLMSKSIVERVFLLQKVQLFRTLSVDDLTAVAANCTEGQAKPGQLIYEEGEPGDSMYVIVSGDIHLFHVGEPLLDLHAGDSFGQTSVLDGGTRPVTAMAGDEGVDFMRLKRQPLLDLMADRPQLVAGLFAELGTRIRELIGLTQLGHKVTQGGASPAQGEPSAAGAT